MQFNLVFTDGNGNTYGNTAPLLGNGSSVTPSVTPNVTYSVASPNSITIPNLTLPSGRQTWTIETDDNFPIYNNNSILINSNYTGGPVQFSFTVN
jgi:hypothetical protein